LEEKHTYRKILKATSIFGSVQLVSILSSIIKSKFLAVFIGPYGYGIYGILNATVDIIKQVSGLGIDASGVKSIAEITNDKDSYLLSKNASILLKLTLLSGIVGVFLTLIFSIPLSQLTYSNTNKWYVFVYIALAVLCKQLASGNHAILQGNNKLHFLAKSNLYANLSSLVLTLPLFYVWKIDAIIPAIILSSFLNYVFSRFFLKKIHLEKQVISYKKAIKEGKSLLFFGSLLVVLSFLPLLVNYLLQIFIGNKDGLYNVGLFNVAMIVLNTYVGFIFTIMATEYYPRLVTVIGSASELSKAVNQQIMISLVLIVPIIVFFIGFGSFTIQLLFSDKFLEIIPMLNWAIFAMLFKAISFSIGYVFIAKADSKVFMKTAIFFNTIYFVFAFVGYTINQLEGVGVAIIIYYVIHLLGVYLIANRRYQFQFDKHLISIFFISLLFGITALSLNFFERGIIITTIFVFLFIISLVFSLYKLDKLVLWLDYFKSKKNGK